MPRDRVPLHTSTFSTYPEPPPGQTDPIFPSQNARRNYEHASYQQPRNGAGSLYPPTPSRTAYPATSNFDEPTRPATSRAPLSGSRTQNQVLGPPFTTITSRSSALPSNRASTTPSREYATETITKDLSRASIGAENMRDTPSRHDKQQKRSASDHARPNQDTRLSSDNVGDFGQSEIPTNKTRSLFSRNKSVPEKDATFAPFDKQSRSSMIRSAVTMTLDERYTVRNSTFFMLGRVFGVLWHEKVTDAATSDCEDTHASDDNKAISTNRFGEKIRSSIRRMVVVRPSHGYSVCIQINTYAGRGLGKFAKSKNVEAIEAHAIVHMADTKARWLDQEPQSGKKAIAVIKAGPDQTLSKASRLDYGRVHTVEHNIQSMNIGRVTDKCLAYLEHDFRQVNTLPQ
ncbi:hypothetical protein H2200_009612 [Cladophialophora chaetospira]|uniref:DUF6590 domain-containing protein n=1 Tax=Cladophialophora chaetospira TaxID=386627 RepID=A0AA38X2R4_9EURO|nr:hypothetical protein H2200_009612 [Cladophialophora chaetospira]